MLGVLAGGYVPAMAGDATEGGREKAGRNKAGELTIGLWDGAGPCEKEGFIVSCEAPSMPERSRCCWSAVLQAAHSK